MSNKNYTMQQQSNNSQNLPQNTFQTTDYYPTQSMNNTYNYQGMNQNNCDASYSNQMINQRNQYNINQQNYYDQQQFLNTSLWATNDVKYANDRGKGIKLIDKIVTADISSKDLSPASCNNIEQLLQMDCSKKDAANYSINTQQQKFVEYPSCSQVRTDRNVPKYCSIQKQSEFNLSYYENDPPLSKNYNNLPQNQSYYNQQSYALSVQIPKPIESNICPLPLSATADFFLNDDINLSFDTINNLDNTHSDDSNSSDIIVEDTEDEEYSETPLSETGSKCFVCNIAYSINGSQFYILTKNAPLTMSSQNSVLSKLNELLGDFNSKCLNIDDLYLCSQCLGLINTIDHLQFKLNSCKVELDAKFGQKLVKNMEIQQQTKNIARKNRGFFCKPCKKIIKFRTLFLSHLKFHNLQTRFLCEYCGRCFRRYRNLHMHRLIHIKDDAKRENSPKFFAYLCKICSKPFRTKSNVKEHENYCSGKLPFKCKLCYKRFTTSTKLKSHVKLKHDKKFNSICSICNIGFIKLSDYKSHMVTHSTDKKYKCSECDKSYKTLGNLNFHMKFHGKTLPYNCGTCAKGFMRKEYLEAHVNIHNNVKNFCCTMCDKTFVSQKNLDAHFKYHDTNTQKKVCNICFKTINTKFEEHLRTHTNLKEFECDLCDLRFNTKSAMAKHKKRKHLELNKNGRDIVENVESSSFQKVEKDCS